MATDTIKECPSQRQACGWEGEGGAAFPLSPRDATHVGDEGESLVGHPVLADEVEGVQHGHAGVLVASHGHVRVDGKHDADSGRKVRCLAMLGTETVPTLEGGWHIGVAAVEH